MKLNIKTKGYTWENLSKFDILRFFENEIDRFQNIIGYTKAQCDHMKSDVAIMISEGKVNENTVADENFIKKLLSNNDDINIKSFSNKELYNRYQEAKATFRNVVEGTLEEIESDRIFTELSQEVENRDHLRMKN